MFRPRRLLLQVACFAAFVMTMAAIFATAEGMDSLVDQRHFQAALYDTIIDHTAGAIPVSRLCRYIVYNAGSIDMAGRLPIPTHY